jgi:aspartyl-tRNA(Asn)/glutamyl-tRNA(Gln) amidotransferase subunit A
MDENLLRLTIANLSRQLRTKELSPVELTTFFLERIEKLNPKLNAYVTVTAEQALADARTAEEEIIAGRYRGSLHGIPFSIKDNIAVKGVRTTAGSKILSDWKPDFDANVVARLKMAGAVILGKTNLHEWALGGTTINPFYGTTRNPWHPDRIAGGSSGGAGAAVTAGMCVGAIGTDSAQSVRNPAAMCGVVGLKPTYGRISQYGTVPGTGAYSTNVTGILTRTVEDCAMVLEKVAGYDSADPLSSDQPVAPYLENIRNDVRGLVVGRLRGYFEDEMADEVKRAFADACDVLTSLGLVVKDVSIPHMDLIPAVKVCTSRVENVSAHDRYLRTRPRDYSPGTLFSYIVALSVPASTYVTAQRVRRVICDEFDELLTQVDLLALPTVPFPAPTIEECKAGYVEVDGKKLKRADARGGTDSLCAIPFNVTGLPALSVCCGFSTAGLPMGMQIGGAAFREELLLRVAHAYERAAQWYERTPDLTGC